jgi:hypothetical protein
LLLRRRLVPHGPPLLRHGEGGWLALVAVVDGLFIFRFFLSLCHLRSAKRQRVDFLHFIMRNVCIERAPCTLFRATLQLALTGIQGMSILLAPDIFLYF